MTDETETSGKSALKPAATNPWYVLMTAAGEQTGEDLTGADWIRGHDSDLHARNRRLWNGWAAQALDEEAKAKLVADGRATQADLAALTEAERKAIDEALASRCPDVERPDPAARPDLSFTEVGAPFIADGLLFPQGADFRSATFSGSADFRSATFSGLADFRSATFSGPADFRSATFSGPTDFLSASFSGPAVFRSAAFSGPADFGSASFSRYAVFGSATFSGGAVFRSASFSRYADFGSATFSGPAFFRSATISRFTDFPIAAFFGPADFSDASFAAATGFRAVRFLREPPKFFGATLHEDTDFTDVGWPPVPDDADPARRRSRAIVHRRAYERLKLLMDGQKKVADELMFQRLELRCREAEAPGAFGAHRWLMARGLRALGRRNAAACRRLEARAWRQTQAWAVTRISRLFGVLSDYGWDPMRPALWLLGVVLAGWLLIFGAEMVDYLWLGWPDCTAWTGPPGACPEAEYLGFGPSLSLSVSNVLGFLGLSRTFLREEIVTLTAVSEVVSAVQTVAGLVLLFLFGLALRNRFRIK